MSTVHHLEVGNKDRIIGGVCDLWTFDRKHYIPAGRPVTLTASLHADCPPSSVSTYFVDA